MCRALRIGVDRGCPVGVFHRCGVAVPLRFVGSTSFGCCVEWLYRGGWWGAGRVWLCWALRCCVKWCHVVSCPVVSCRVASRRVASSHVVDKSR